MIALSQLSINRRGIALFSTLIAILLLTALTTATFFRSATAASTTQIAILRQHALFAAERALWSTITASDAADLSLQPITTSRHVTSSDSSHGLTTNVVTTKVDSALYWISSHATMTRGPRSAKARVGISVRMAQNPIDSSLFLVPLTPHAWLDLH